MKLKLLILALSVVAVSNALRCYDCDPTTDGQCTTPEKDNTKTTVCEEDDGATIPPTYLKKLINDIDKTEIETRVTNRAELQFECFTMFYETEEEGETSGVYRGCIEKSKYIDSSCSYLEEWLNKGNVSCQTCPDDKCNDEYVGGAAALTVSLGIVMLNLLLCVKVFTF